LTSHEIKEIQEKVLIFLYWEGTIDLRYLSVRKIEDETELSSRFVENGVKTLRENGWVECNIREKDLGIEDVRITVKGIEKAQSLISKEGMLESR
jgi:DNA-binding MarR family transcriptional regulator